MTAPGPNKARKFADAAAALGWVVEKKKDGDMFLALCSRGNEKFNLAWAPGQRGLTFDSGWHWVDDEPVAEITSPSEALKEMARLEQIDLRLMDDATVLAHLTDRTIYWTNSLSGAEESAHVPANSQHSKIEVKRAITFTTPEGFRSVAIDKITAVR